MVNTQAAKDLETVTDDIRDAMLHGGSDFERMRNWVTGLEFVATRLKGPHCEECGGPMTFSPDLREYVCHHVEE